MASRHMGLDGSLRDDCHCYWVTSKVGQRVFSGLQMHMRLFIWKQSQQGHMTTTHISSPVSMLLSKLNAKLWGNNYVAGIHFKVITSSHHLTAIQFSASPFALLLLVFSIQQANHTIQHHIDHNTVKSYRLFFPFPFSLSHYMGLATIQGSRWDRCAS
ncbi:hypothetical protein J3F84DRAFT_169600 [Trichoderma pleuroticola]